MQFRKLRGREEDQKQRAQEKTHN